MLKIMHYADMQIEVRTSGAGSQRLDEFTHDFKQLEEVVSKEQPDIVVIAGDIFEFWQSNGDEQKIFARHLRNILPNTKRIIIIPGNHDVRQRGIALDSIIHNKRNITDCIDPIVTAISSDKISYYKDTGFYIDNTFDITWAVWSQLTKHSMNEPKPVYSPWDAEADISITTKNCIELFHDPVRGAADFSGQPNPLFSEYKIGLDNFRANTIIAGDIHAPWINWFGIEKERLFTYSSSTTQRNFGEGDYYNNLNKYIDGNSRHGYNIIMFDDENDVAVSCQFNELKHIVSRHTYYINDKFNYDTMINALSIDSTAFNKIRLVCQSGLTQFIENEQKLIEHFKSLCQCSVSTDYAKDVLGVEVNEDEFADLSEVIDKDKILKISKTYIDAIVDKTSTIDKEDKQRSKDYIYELFKAQLDETELINARQIIILRSAIISGFMPFDEKIELQFSKKSITQISGTNGIGKTKLFDFIKWIWSDKIIANQNDRNKRFNYSFYFNDSSENDEVRGQLVFEVNGDTHVLSKTLTRSWKKDQKDISDKNWPDRLSGTPTVSMTLDSNALTSTNTEEIQSYLNSLMSFEDFELFVFANAESLNGFTQMKTEVLSDIFLSVLGIDVTNTILEKYNELKEEKLSKLTKPSITIDAALQKIALSEEQFKKYDDNIRDARVQITQEEKILENHNDEANKLRSTLHQVDTVPVIEASIERLNTANTQNASTKNQLLEDIVKLENSKQELSLDLLRDKKHIAEKDELNATNEYSVHLAKIENAQKDIDNALKNVQSVATQVKLDLKDSIKSTEDKLIALERQENKINNDIATLQSEYKDYIREQIDKIELNIKTVDAEIAQRAQQKNDNTHAISSCNLEIRRLESHIESLTSQIKTLESSTKCPTCETPKNAEALQAIQLKIAELNTQIDESRQSILAETDKRKVVEDTNNALTIEIDELLTTKVTPLNNAIKTLKDDMNLSLQSLYDENLIRYQKFIDKWLALIEPLKALQKEHNELQVIVDEFNGTFNDKLKSHKDVQAALVEVSQFKDIKSSLEALTVTFTDKISSIQATLQSIDHDINTLNNIDTQINTKRDELAQIDEQLEQYVSSLSQLNKDLSNALLNVDTNKKLQEILVKVQAQKSIIQQIQNDIRQNELYMISMTQEIKNMNTTIHDIKEYKIVDNSLKLYKKLLGKSGLPQYIFAHLIPLINKKLNDSLSSVDFRLLFDSESLELRFIDLTKNISRPVQFLSGMQKTIVGLAVIHVLRLLNHSKQFDVLMIDEISGKFNDGSKLSYEAKDYKDIAKQFILELSKHSKIYIVDHVIDFSDDNTSIIEVQPATNGATIKQS